MSILLGCFWSLYTPLFLTRDAFEFEFFENVLVIAFSIFCFGISALGFFYLGALLGCCLTMLVDSGGCGVILLLFISFNSKNTIFFSFCIIMHCLHCLHLHGT